MSETNNPLDFSIFKNFVGLFGNIFGLTFYIAPIILMVKLHKKQLDPLKTPYLIMIMNVMNCLLWASYGFLIDDFFLILANGIGCPINLLYLCMYFFYRSEKKILKSFILIFPTLIFVLGLFYFLTFTLKNEEVSNYSAMIFNILMYGAPGQNIVL